MGRNCKYKLTDIGAVADAIDRARAYQADRDLPLTVQAIAMQLGIGRDAVRAYALGDNFDDVGYSDDERAIYEAVSGLIGKAYRECDCGISNILLKPGNNNGAAFIAKNCYGYKDRQEQDLTVKLPVFDGDDDV